MFATLHTFLALCIIVLPLAASEGTGRTLIFGVIPQQNPAVIIKKWTPVVNYLGKACGCSIVLKTEKSIPEFKDKLYGGLYDIAYASPLDYVHSHSTGGYLPLVRARKKIVGILVSKRDHIGKTDELGVRTFLFPSANAFGASVLLKYELQHHYGIAFTSENSSYVTSHDSVYKGVSRNIGIYGGGVERTFFQMDPGIRKTLHILYKTKGYPAHPVCVHPRLDTTLQERLKTALLQLPTEILRTLSLDGLVETSDSEYDVIRKLVGAMGRNP